MKSNHHAYVTVGELYKRAAAEGNVDALIVDALLAWFVSQRA